MKWSFPIGRIFGIQLRVHGIFLIVPLLVGLQNAGNGFGMALLAGALTLLVFCFVVLHELGHSLMALRCGVGVRDITLLPIGGVARLESIPEDSATELKIAVAGPLVNVLLVLLMLPVFFIAFAGSYGGVKFLPYGPAELLLGLIAINVIMAAFNLVPAFPLDGGRILRALLALRMPHVKATRLAARVGRILAVLMFAAAVLTGSWVLCFVAAFIFLAGTAEERMVRARHAYREKLLRAAERFESPSPPLTPTTEAAQAFESIARTFRPGPSRRPRL